MPLPDPAAYLRRPSDALEGRAPLPDPAALPGDAELTERTRALLRLLSPLPDPALLPGERMTLGGSLLPEAPWLVELVAQALEQDPDLFADVPLPAAALREEQARALAYRGLRDALDLLLRRASDGYTLCQARALRGAMDVLRQVRADGDRPFAGPQDGARAAALAPAERLLARRAPRQRPRDDRAAQRPEPSPQRRLADRASRTRAHAALDGLALRAAQPPERPTTRPTPRPTTSPAQRPRTTPPLHRLSGLRAAPPDPDPQRAAQPSAPFTTTDPDPAK